MQADPAAAADIARAMAVALAGAGASAEDIARTMQEALSARISGTGPTSPDDLLEIAQTVARVMAEAGASPEEIQTAMRTEIKLINLNLKHFKHYTPDQRPVVSYSE